MRCLPHSLLKVRYGPRSLVYAIHRLWIESPEEAYCLLVHGEYQRVRRYRPYRRDAPTPVQAPVPLHPVHVGERIRERPRHVPVIRVHLAPHHVGGVEGHPVRDARRSASKHVVDIARSRFIPPSGIWNLHLIGAVPTELARTQACTADQNMWMIDCFCFRSCRNMTNNCRR